MKLKCFALFLVPVIVLFFLPGCSGGASKNTFPPPEGYSSWEEYHQANSPQVTKTPTEEEKRVAAQNIEALEGLEEIYKEQAEKDIEEANRKYGTLDDYFTPIRITGSGDKTSEPFKVTTDEWVIDWSFETADSDMSVFWFYIFPRGETILYVECILFPEETSGSTYSYTGPGEYYIKVGAGNIDNWTITIKPP